MRGKWRRYWKIPANCSLKRDLYSRRRRDFRGSGRVPQIPSSGAFGRAAVFSGDFRAAPQVGALTPPCGVLRSAAAHLHVPRGGDMFPPDLSCVSGRCEFGRRTRIPPGRCRSPASYRRRARSEPPGECLFLSKSGQRGMAVTQWRGALVKGSGSGVEGPAGPVSSRVIRCPQARADFQFLRLQNER